MERPDGFLHWALGWISGQRAGDADGPVFDRARDDALGFSPAEREFVHRFPEGPAPGDELRSRVEHLFADHLANARGPRFQSQLFSGIDDEALAGYIAGTFSHNTISTREVAPLPTEIERAVISWLLRLVPWQAAGAGGTVTPAGSFSNYLAVYLARKRATAAHGEDAIHRLAVFTSEASHYSLDKGADLAGLPLTNVVRVPIDERDRMRPDALEAAVTHARSRGLVPAMVTATLGTTVSGALDPVSAIGEIAVGEGMWLHVDGAWGGIGLWSSDAPRFRNGLERADSLTWDAHKAAWAPLALSFLLVRDRSSLYSLRPPHGGGYLFQDHDAAPEEEDLGLTSLYCGKPFHSLALWLLWKSRGTTGMQERVDRAFELAGRFRDRIAASPLFEVVQEPETPAVCVRPVAPPGATPAEKEALAREVRERFVEDGRWLIRLCPRQGEMVIRAIFANPLMTEAKVDEFVERLEACHPSPDAVVDTGARTQTTR